MISATMTDDLGGASSLVPNEHDGHVRVRVGPRVVEPAGEVVERVAPRDVVHEQRAGGAAVVRARDRSERLLPRLRSKRTRPALSGSHADGRCACASRGRSSSAARGAHRVPDLQLDLLVVNVNHPRAELDPDGEVVHLLEPLVRELQQQTGLADARVTNDDVPAASRALASCC